jgi:hypothetical protein
VALGVLAMPFPTVGNALPFPAADEGQPCPAKGHGKGRVRRLVSLFSLEQDYIINGKGPNYPHYCSKRLDYPSFFFFIARAPLGGCFTYKIIIFRNSHDAFSY